MCYGIIFRINQEVNERIRLMERTKTMDRTEFRDILERKILVLDGAIGTELQRRGMPRGVCPELWALENPHVLIELQQEYQEAGSDVVYTFTLGGTRIKLDEYGLGERTVEINRELAKVSRKAVGEMTLVAGDISTTGHLVKPFGEMEFDYAVEIFAEQIRGLVDGGVDFLIIETMIDIQEARAALIAAKETCDLPVCVSMTFNESKRTLTGTDPVTALITLQSLGVDAVGCNCSTGPAEMVSVIAEMKKHAYVPIIAKPNAGLPVLKNGETVFTMDAEEFGSHVEAFIRSGVNLLGGCCGTSPAFVAQIAERTAGIRPVASDSEKVGALTSARRTVFIGGDRPVVMIGERINPTGKKKLQQSLLEKDMGEVKRLAREQEANGAAVLDINAGMPGIDETQTVSRIVEELSVDADLPLCIDSSNTEVIEKTLRIYPGRALVNSLTGEVDKMERLLPVMKKYGAMFILLPLDEKGIPHSAAERCSIIEKVYEKASEYGFTKDDFLADGLTMTVSSDQGAAKAALEVIEWCAKEFGCGTVIGLSNISYGMPQREWINASFLAMAIARGLSCVIANPSSKAVEGIRLASDVLTGKDKGCMNYISRYSDEVKEDLIQEEREYRNTLELLYDCVISGSTETVVELVKKAVEEGTNAAAIVNEQLIPAITRVGDLYESGKYFLPQLIRSAETVKRAFTYLEPLLKAGGAGQTEKRPVVVLATVKGDIHDIGKNIVGLMLGNHGFDVLDLGKDVDPRIIVSRARESGADIIGLSALMTTTMIEMKNVIDLAKAEGLKCKFMVGGAAVNSAFADEIGADGYAEDANKAVRLAWELVGGKGKSDA
jgi:5-methyltetrahydrofolate--homocysteine methyltransferase